MVTWVSNICFLSLTFFNSYVWLKDRKSPAARINLQRCYRSCTNSLNYYYNTYSWNIWYLTKDSKTGNIHCFFLENLTSLFIPAQLFLSQNNIKEKLYANIPEMFNFNPKISIQKYPIFCSWYNFSSANVSDLYRYFTAKNWKIWGFISLQKNYTTLTPFNNKTYLF